ncbi:MAG TPA: DUF6036 family nucleotidyltransferase [Actinomycetota bacterium]|nr:DUF6036 family nucleotidyltransferase [Actinomycetota bacterium]
MTTPEFDPARIFQVLAHHDVDYVVIGAMAAMLQGAGPTMTLDVDVAAATAEENRVRLASALKEMEARLRVPAPEDPVEIPLDARMLGSMKVMTFITRFGPFDVLFAPDGAPTYERLRERAVEVTRFGVAIRAAGVEDLIAMKRATGREKDAAHLTTLIQFLKDRALPGKKQGRRDD